MSGMREATKLSARLNAIADSVREMAKEYDTPPRLADIGCDHALIPVSLLLSGDVSFAYASDVREGPLQAAKENAVRFGVEEKMRFVLADGLAGIGKNETDVCVIAGMGGELVRAVLEAGDAYEKGISVLVLSPHTKQETLREYLAGSAFRIVSEKMTEEDGKFYPVITAVSAHAPRALSSQVRENLFADVSDAIARQTGCGLRDAERLCYLSGPLLLEERNPVLHDVLVRRHKRLAGILEQTANLEHVPEEASEQMRLVTYALQWFEKEKRA